MGAIASQITSLTIVYSTVYSDADQRKHQSSASLAFVRGIHRFPVNSPHQWPVTRKMFPFDDVIMLSPLNTEACQGLPSRDWWTGAYEIFTQRAGVTNSNQVILNISHPRRRDAWFYRYHSHLNLPDKLNYGKNNQQLVVPFQTWWGSMTKAQTGILVTIWNFVLKA